MKGKADARRSGPQPIPASRRFADHPVGEQIELVFGHFKKRGFDLEATHMSAPDKIEKLFGVLTLAFLISYGWGCEMKRNTALTTPRKRKSIFRLGLDRIARLLAHGEDFDEEIRTLLEWFERPKHHSIFVV